MCHTKRYIRPYRSFFGRIYRSFLRALADSPTKKSLHAAYVALILHLLSIYGRRTAGICPVHLCMRCNLFVVVNYAVVVYELFLPWSVNVYAYLYIIALRHCSIVVAILPTVLLDYAAILS